jgi:hypothetical protein
LTFVSGKPIIAAPYWLQVAKSVERVRALYLMEIPLGFWRRTLKIVELSMIGREWPQLSRRSYCGS